MKADLLITHARVMTADPARPRAEAVALRGNRILFVGGNEDAESLRGEGTRYFHAGGRTVLPGFIDSHYHLLMGSAEMGNAALEGVNSLEELGEVLRTHAQEHPEAAWVCGSHLKYDLLPDGRRLSRHDLDAILADRPVAVMAYDYHTLWRIRWPWSWQASCEAAPAVRTVRS